MFFTNKQAALLNKTLCGIFLLTELKNEVFQVAAKKELKKKKKKKSDGRSKNVYDRLIQPKLHLISDWARNGATMEEIAKKLGTSKQTLYRYYNLQPALCDALKTRDEADAMVEASLFKRAIGYDYVEKKIKREYVASLGCMAVTEEVTITKHIEPDVTAIQTWLNNRRPDKWRQKQIDDVTDTAQILSDFIRATNKVASTPEAKVDLE